LPAVGTKMKGDRCSAILTMTHLGKSTWFGALS
jgi:hypothetical protein